MLISCESGVHVDFNVRLMRIFFNSIFTRLIFISEDFSLITAGKAIQKAQEYMWYYLKESTGIYVVLSKRKHRNICGTI